MKSSTYYFHMKTKTLADFEICISVPLKQKLQKLDQLTTNGKIYPQEYSVNLKDHILKIYMSVVIEYFLNRDIDHRLNILNYFKSLTIDQLAFCRKFYLCRIYVICLSFLSPFSL